MSRYRKVPIMPEGKGWEEEEEEERRAQGSPFNRATVQEHGWISLGTVREVATRPRGPVALLTYPS